MPVKWPRKPHREPWWAILLLPVAWIALPVMWVWRRVFPLPPLPKVEQRPTIVFVAPDNTDSDLCFWVKEGVPGWFDRAIAGFYSKRQAEEYAERFRAYRAGKAPYPVPPEVG